MGKFLQKIFKKPFGIVFVQDKGAVAIITGLALVVCIGFAALAVDVGIWYDQRRQLQLAADAGAVGGAVAIATTGKATYQTYATHDINMNGCTSSTNCTINFINNPPSSGPNTSNFSAVEIVLSQPAQLYLAGFFLATPPTITVRAVAKAASVSNCIVTLAKSGTGLRLTGGSGTTSPNCGVYINSPDSNALSLTPGTSVTANKVSVVGGWNGAGTVLPAPVTGVPALADPYASFTPPSFSGCNQTNFSTGTSQILSPGVYCGGITLNSGANITLNPGIYYLDKGQFKVAGNATVTGTGVTIILTSSTGSNYATANVSGGATFNLSAPTSGPTTGFLFYGDRNSSGLSHDFSGGVNQKFNGLLYFPTSDIKYAGQTSGTGTPCLQLVAQHVTLVGQTSLNNSCGPVLGGISLVE
jgi:hypothetical protein